MYSKQVLTLLVIITVTPVFLGGFALSLKKKNTKSTSKAKITTKKISICPLALCAFPEDCDSYIIGNFTLRDGT